MEFCSSPAILLAFLYSLLLLFTDDEKYQVMRQDVRTLWTKAVVQYQTWLKHQAHRPIA